MAKYLDRFLRSPNDCSSQPSGSMHATSAEIVKRDAPRWGLFDGLFLLNGLLASGFWVSYVSSGFQSEGILDGYYVLQARALLEGRLSISPGPLDMFYHDVSLYGGSYYFYWGMLPAAMFAVFQRLCGATIAHYGVVWIFLFSLVYYYQIIVALIISCAGNDGHYENPTVQLWAMPLVWLFIFNPPFYNTDNWFFGRFVIYEQAIVFGLALVTPALFLILRGLTKRRPSDLCGASFLLCLATCSRASWGLLMCLSIPLALWGILRLKARIRKGRFGGIGYLKWLLGTLSVGVGLAALNFARFGSPLDVGVVHQNAAAFVYQRSIVSLFSLETGLWDFICNALWYYGPTNWPQSLGVIAKSSTFVEGVPPGFFAFAPQFILPAVCAPIAFYKVWRGKQALVIPFLVTGGAALYITVFICAVGILVVMRFFVECYILLLLFLFVVALSSLPRWCAIALTAASLGIYVPHNAASFIKITPQLRLLDPAAAGAAPLNSRQVNATFFLEPNPVWHQGSVSIQTLASGRLYNLIGLRGARDQLLAGEDILAAYIIPSTGAHTLAGASGVVRIKGLRAIGVDGSIAVFLDRRPVGRIPVTTDQSLDAEMILAVPLTNGGPLQVLLAFFPGNGTSLAPRPLFSPAFVFTEIALGRSGP